MNEVVLLFLIFAVFTGIVATAFAYNDLVLVINGEYNQSLFWVVGYYAPTFCIVLGAIYMQMTIKEGRTQ